MAKLARDIMTNDPACCSPQTPLDQVARMMVQHDCGEIPVVDTSDRVIGVVTDRDIVCRMVAEGKNPGAYTAESCMSSPAISVMTDVAIDDVLAAMEKYKIRRVLVTDDEGCCAGIISQADIAVAQPASHVAELLYEVSKDEGPASLRHA